MQLSSNLVKPKVQRTLQPNIVIVEVAELAVEQNLDVEVAGKAVETGENCGGTICNCTPTY